MNTIKDHRNFMKSIFDSWKNVTASDQMQGIPAPPLQKSPKRTSNLIGLPTAYETTYPLYTALTERRSVRQYHDTTMTFEELGFLLESSCKVQKVIGDHIASFRPAPSGGARHPFETYLIINRIEGIADGAYHYLPLTHELEPLETPLITPQMISDSVNGQKFAAASNVVFYFAIVPYRAEWRYGLKSHKVMLIDLGHMAQNLCLAAEAIGSGACPIASYDQDKADALFGLDGDNEFVSYIVPVGKKITT